MSLSDGHFIAVSDRSAAVWEYGNGIYGNLNKKYDDDCDSESNLQSRDIPFSSPHQIILPNTIEVRKSLNIKNLPENSGALISHSSIIICPFDVPIGGFIR
jgi:hypothetical protein